MKILFVCESFPTSVNADFTGGVEARDYYTACELAKSHQVTVMTGARLGAKSQESLSGIRVVRLGKAVAHQDRESLFVRLFLAIKILWAGIRADFDIAVGTNFFTQLLVGVFVLPRGKKAVALAADVYLGRWSQLASRPTALLGHTIEWLVWKMNWAGIIAVSQSTADKLVSLGIKPSKIRVIYGGLDAKGYGRHKLAKTSTPQIIFAGRLVKYKRVDDLIKALSLLKRKLPAISLTIVGEGPEKDHLVALAQDLSVADRVVFTGFQSHHSQVLALISQSSVFCNPSVVEGFGLVTLEALAMGTPYVNADLPVTREVTKGSQGGLLHLAKDPQDLAKQVYRLLTEIDIYRDKLKEAKNLIESYSWQQVAISTEEYLESLVKDRPGHEA